MKKLILLCLTNFVLQSSTCFSNELFTNNLKDISNSSFNAYLSKSHDDPILFQLLSFSVKHSGSENNIQWVMIEEYNNDYFTVERTNDGIVYETVGIVNGAGSSLIERNYSLIDANFANEINYYRIKMTDYDGISKISELISIDNRLPKTKEISSVFGTDGHVVNESYQGLVFIRYVDGTTTKTMK